MSDNSKALAATPPMGWNSWNQFGAKVDEKSVRESAKALVDLGLKDLGYEYVVIDDCWSVKDARDGNGNLVADPVKFPGGIKALADYVHSLGLKMGIYSCAGDKTCAGYPGSVGFERQDAALWAGWGVDFLKYDYCYAPADQETAVARYNAMGQALRGCGRTMLYSLCEWGGRAPHLWGREAGGHMWRVSGDVFDSWVDVWVPTPGTHQPGYWGLGVNTSLDIAADLAEYGGPGGWNDLDMLIVGLKGKGAVHGAGLGFLEYQTHMALWVMACSPLMIGCDIRAMDHDTAALLLNREVLAVNQDPLGRPARRVRQLPGGCEVWAKRLADGKVAAALVNRGHVGAEISMKSVDVGLLDRAKPVRDLWAGEDIGDMGESLTRKVLPHQTLFLKIG